MDSQKERIHVSVRSRPLLSETPSLQLISKEPPILLLLERSQTYQFDNVFLEDADQEKVYNDAVKPLVDLVKSGFNCTVFAYGQTGTGKTYTMGSGSQFQSEFHTGIIPRALDQLLNEVNVNSFENEIDVHISFLEIYNEKVFDLLQSDCKSPLPVSGFTVPGLSRKNVKTAFRASEWLELGNKNRHIGETRQNANSSRSHAVFTVYISTKTSSEEIFGKLNLVDLAGSESVKKTGSKGGTFQEGININKGLLCIGQVISALCARSSYIPYRQSMITSILKESLNIDNYISLIACVSADPEDITETLQTLDFAQRTKRIRCNPEVVAKFKKDNLKCFKHVRSSMKRSITPLKTPMSRRLGAPLLPSINERHSEISHAERPLSINLSAKRTISEITAVQQMLSPMVKKHMAKTEALILERLTNLESVIQNTLSRPTRRSLRLVSAESLEGKNTPKIAWDKIQDTVTKMISSEFAQLIQKTARAASTPINDNHNPLPSKKLFNDESLDTSAIVNSLQDLPPKDFSFKIPLKPPPLAKTQNDISKSSATRRRSARLALKHQSVELSNSDWLFDSVITSSKRKKSEDDTLKELMNNTPIFNNCNGHHKTNTGTERKSMRHNKAQKCNKKFVNTPPENRGSKKQRSIESPYTLHSKMVLKLLNHGTQKNLVDKLHSIGVKTADTIVTFRVLHGGFSEIVDLSKMPGWGPQRYERFLSLNFLKKT